MNLEIDENLLSIYDNIAEAELKLEKTIVDSEIHIINIPTKLFAEDIVIYNSLGKMIKKIQLVLSSNLKINCSDLANGIYFLTIPNFQIKPIKIIVSH
jgi:hypothetical protein